MMASTHIGRLDKPARAWSAALGSFIKRGEEGFFFFSNLLPVHFVLRFEGLGQFLN